MHIYFRQLNCYKIIVDGYNVIHAIPRIEGYLGKSLEDARKALADFLVTWQRKRKYKGKICIVFDGKDEFYSANATLGGIQCIFTKTKEDADGRIISLVRNAKNPGKIIVISNDNNVANSSKAHGAKVENARFLLLPRKTKSASKAKTEGSDKMLDGAATRDINEWLEKKWGL